jgi:hypothetical protein
MRARFSWVAAAGLVFAVSATAQAQKSTSTPCKDGTTSTAIGRGACSGHGGVDGEKLAAQKKAAHAAREAAKKTAKAEEKAESKAVKREEKAAATMVKCTDGTTSKGGRGACSHHGGIARGAKR